jgi:S-methylmethionine-dependent homocysteine/selenocysteine methylase
VPGHYSITPHPPSAAYRHVERRMSEDVAILDGGVSTELGRVRREARMRSSRPWGGWALHEAHTHTVEVHRRFIEAGCDVISTNTWGIMDAAGLRDSPPPTARRSRPYWVETARTALRLARVAVAEAGREESCAVAFCIDGDLQSGAALGPLELLIEAWADDPPDLVLLETLGEISTEALAAVAELRDTGLPVWLSMQVGRADVASNPELPERIAQLDTRALDALLLNCAHPTELSGAVRLLSQVTRIPLGVYPRLGRQGEGRWEFDPTVGPLEFAEWARAFRREGACILGGCCGVTPEHLSALADSLRRKAADAPAVLPW